MKISTSDVRRIQRTLRRHRPIISRNHTRQNGCSWSQKGNGNSLKCCGLGLSDTTDSYKNIHGDHSGNTNQINSNNTNGKDVVSLGAAVYTSGVISFIIEKTLRQAIEHAKQNLDPASSSTEHVLARKLTDQNIFGGICRDLELKHFYDLVTSDENKDCGFHKSEDNEQNCQCYHGSRCAMTINEGYARLGNKSLPYRQLRSGLSEDSLMFLKVFVCISIWCWCSVLF